MRWVISCSRQRDILQRFMNMRQRKMERSLQRLAHHRERETQLLGHISTALHQGHLDGYSSEISEVSDMSDRAGEGALRRGDFR